MMGGVIGKDDIERALEALAERRPVFRSEADFQHEFAWEIREHNPNLSIRLEYPVPIEDQSGRIDIWMPGGDGGVAIELKYWTRQFDRMVYGEHFHLVNQSAEPPNRYSFIKDVTRCEDLLAGFYARAAFVVAVTNNPAFWDPNASSKVGADFLIPDGRTLSGKLAWAPETAKGTQEGKEDPLALQGTHQLAWKDYSVIPDAPYGKFRYLLIDVGAGRA